MDLLESSDVKRFAWLYVDLTELKLHKRLIDALGHHIRSNEACKGLVNVDKYFQHQEMEIIKIAFKVGRVTYSNEDLENLLQKER